MTKNKRFLSGLAAVIMGLVSILVPYGAASAFTVSPQTQEYTLTPGQSVTGEVTAVNAYNAEGTFYYVAEVVPYSVSNDGNYSPNFDTGDDYTDIVNWVTLSDDDETNKTAVHGVLEPGESGKVHYTVKVPLDARGGGQYFAVRVKNDIDAAKKAEGSDTITINEIVGIVSLVFVEVSGDITVKGEIINNNIPSFLSNPPISASFMVKNDGNTHAQISYFLQVFPLFSDEEVYTTEENPGTNYVLPGSSRMVTQTWDDTPAVGIFKVRQTVYYDSTDTEPSVTEKMVIVCPIWLLFVVVLVAVAVVVWIVIRVKSRKKKEND